MMSRVAHESAARGLVIGLAGMSKRLELIIGLPPPGSLLDVAADEAQIGKEFLFAKELGKHICRHLGSRGVGDRDDTPLYLLCDIA